MTELGEYLRRLREDLDMSQEKLAQKIKVSQAAISQFEHGTIKPRPATLVALARALGRPPDELLASAGFYAARVPPLLPLGEGDVPAPATASETAPREVADPVEGVAQELLSSLRTQVPPERWRHVVGQLGRLVSVAWVEGMVRAVEAPPARPSVEPAAPEQPSEQEAEYDLALSRRPGHRFLRSLQRRLRIAPSAASEQPADRATPRRFAARGTFVRDAERLSPLERNELFEAVREVVLALNDGNEPPGDLGARRYPDDDDLYEAMWSGGGRFTYQTTGSRKDVVIFRRAGKVEMNRQMDSSSDWRAPNLLPPAIEDLIDRRNALSQIFDTLRPGESALTTTTTVIVGPAGVGTTTLTVWAAHQLRAQFPDAQLYANLKEVGSEPVEASEVLIGFMHALGIRDDDPAGGFEDRVKRFHKALAGRRVLVVLDNATDEAQVRPLLPASAGCAALVTSRSSLSGLDPEQVVKLDVLEPRFAIELLESIVGADRLQTVREAAEEIAQLCDYLPLGLQMAGAILAARPEWDLHSFVERLALSRSRFATTSDGPAVPASVALSYQELGDEARRAFRLLGLLDSSDFAPWTLDVLLDSDEPRAAVLIDELVDAGLLEAANGGVPHDPKHADPTTRYRFHDLLRNFAQQRLADEEPPASQAAAQERVILSYATLANQLDAALRPGLQETSSLDEEWRPPGGAELTEDSRSNPLRWFSAERHCFVAAVSQAYERRMGSVTWQLAGSLAFFFAIRSHWEEWRLTHQQGLEASMQAHDRRGTAEMLFGLGALYREQGRWDDAERYFKRSRTLFRDIDDKQKEALALRNLGIIARNQGHLFQADTDLRHCLEIFKRLRDRRCQALALSNLGNLYSEQGRFDDAAVRLNESLEIFKNLGDRRGEALVLASLGDLYRRQGSPGTAIKTLKSSLDIFQALGDRRGEARNQSTLGLLFRRQGRWDEAFAVEVRCLEIFRDLGDLAHQARSLRELGTIRRYWGHWELATAGFDRSLTILRGLGDRRGQAYTLLSWGHLHRDRRLWEQATTAFRQSGEIFSELDDERGEAGSKTGLGIVLRNQGLHHEAIERLEESLATNKKLRDRVGEALTLVSLGNSYCNIGEFDKGIRYLLDSVQLHEDLGDDIGRAQARANLGIAYRDHGQVEDAIECLAGSLQTLQRSGNRLWEAYTLAALATLQPPEEGNRTRHHAVSIFRQLGLHELADRIEDLEDSPGLLLAS